MSPSSPSLLAATICASSSPANRARPPNELAGRECVDAITEALDGSRANIPPALRELRAAGMEVDAEVADFFTPFTSKSLELTGLATPDEDFHPNAAGHREMALETIRAFGRRNQDSGGSGD